MSRILCILVIIAYGITAFPQSDSSAIFFQKGLEEKNARRFREAEKNFTKAYQLSPNKMEVVLELANSLMSQNRYAEAREKYLAAEKINGNDPAVVENLATLSFNMRKWPEAIQYANKVQQLKIDKPVYYIIGKSYFEQENYGEAIKFLDLAAKEEPAKADIPYTIGRAYLDMSNYKQSAAYIEKAILLDSSRINWIYECGLVYYAIPDYKKSLQFLELAGTRGYNRNNDYLQNLGNAYMNTAQYEKGIELFKEVLKKKPSDQELLYEVAQANFKAGKFQEAIDYWDQLLTLDKNNARVLYMIGLSYQKKGDKQKGMQLCDKAIEMDPSLNSLREKQGGLM